MKSNEFDSLCSEQIAYCLSILNDKAQEYAQNQDRLHNFRVASQLQGKPMKSVLAGMMAKHTISIYDMCGSPEDTEYPMDLWREKITDSINYLLLLNAVVMEEYELFVTSECCGDGGV